RGEALAGLAAEVWPSLSSMLKEFSGCEMHMTHMPSPGDEEGLRRLGVNLTTEAVFATDDLYTL
ncbi:MAG: DUF1846 family protein, partial [Desulfobacterales bacterium]|nr:DUF1846 family protein [Desulfobacterales bacterium]